MNDKAYNDKVQAASAELDRPTQAKLWQALNKEAMQNAWVIPTFFELQQRMAGTKISGCKRRVPLGPAGSWPYATMSVNQ